MTTVRNTTSGSSDPQVPLQNTSPYNNVQVANDLSNQTLSVQNQESYLLSQLPIENNTLLFGLNFKYTKVLKSGFINRMKGNKESMDIDLSCILFGDHLKIIDTIWFKNLRDKSEAIRHHGDSLNGRDRGPQAELDRNFDVETIELRLSKLPLTVKHIGLLLSSYTGAPLTSVERGDVYISDDEGNELYSTDITLLNTNSAALCVAILSRELGEWRFTKMSLPLSSTEIEAMAEQVINELARVHS